MKIIKRIVLVVSGILAVGILVINQIGTVATCNNDWRCYHALADIIIMLLPTIPLFLLSLITYRMRDAVVRPWLYFTAGWIPLSMVLIHSAPSRSHSSALSVFPLVKGFVAFSVSVLFVLISVIILARAWWKQRKQAASKS